MSRFDNQEWRAKAIKLAEKGLSWREVARVIGVPRSTVSDYLRYHYKGYVNPSEIKAKKSGGLGNKPRILVLDIETSPSLFGGFSLFNQNFSLNQIHEDWTILSFGWKWWEDDEASYVDVVENDEYSILQKLHELLSESDFVLGHNVRRFDLKKIKARMIVHGFLPFGTPRVIDTFEVAKREFGFTSNKLEYLTHKLCKKYKKSTHEKFSGYRFWKEFLAGNKEAIDEMREYCQLDVQSVQELYEIMYPWDSRAPNFDLYSDEKPSLDNWEHVGYHYTNLGKYDKYRNKITGQYRRGRTNLLTKDYRENILANIL